MVKLKCLKGVEEHILFIGVYNIKRNTKERGVDDASKLPRYYYRDDGYRVWDAIESYVTEIIDMFYVNDASVSEDEELQSFANDVHFNGFPHLVMSFRLQLQLRPN